MKKINVIGKGVEMNQSKKKILIYTLQQQLVLVH